MGRGGIVVPPALGEDFFEHRCCQGRLGKFVDVAISTWGFPGWSTDGDLLPCKAWLTSLP
jgi:hypothetical protein